MKTMAEMNELHFETIDRNKDINLQRNKLKFLEDRWIKNNFSEHT